MIATVLFDSSGSIGEPVEPKRLACASILKPLYAWLGDGSADDKERMVQLSDNEATSRVIGATGGLSIMLDRIYKATGINWHDAPSWGSVRVTASEVAAAFAKLDSTQVLADMRAVPARQQLGLVELWAELTSQSTDQIGVKLGWDLHFKETALRTHAVLIGPDRSVVVTSAILVDGSTRAQWHRTLSSRGPESVLPIHEQFAGPELALALTKAAA